MSLSFSHTCPCCEAKVGPSVWWRYFYRPADHLTHCSHCEVPLRLERSPISLVEAAVVSALFPILTAVLAVSCSETSTFLDILKWVLLLSPLYFFLLFFVCYVRMRFVQVDESKA